VIAPDGQFVACVFAGADAKEAAVRRAEERSEVDAWVIGKGIPGKGFQAQSEPNPWPENRKTGTVNFARRTDRKAKWFATTR
jgi:hypothetical protein